MEKSNTSWTKKEWKDMRGKLEKLSIEDIRLLAEKVGVKFNGGNVSISDNRHVSAKEQFILVLDEVPKDILLKEYLLLTRKS
jgi:hypothetical protein